MSTKTSSPIIDRSECSLFITTRPSRDVEMPDFFQKISARRMIERAWAEDHGMDAGQVMGSDTSVGTTSDTPPPAPGSSTTVGDKITTDAEPYNTF